jgi:hypothetical protein
MRIKLTFTAAQPFECSADLENALNKVLFNLKRNVLKYVRAEQWDMVKTYAGDLDDWMWIHKALVDLGNPREARRIYAGMDTASRDFLSEYGGITSASGELCKEAEKVFNISFK